MFTRFLFGKIKKATQDMHPPGVSLIRRILVWVLIIAFWVAYYWFHEPTAP